ncbi:asparaginase [Pseudactinotalea sp.]|uniref:asparaginase n=1 Tax=Pseudactinotalea sp. TaxID=1926260 RepID=UPI003B3B0A6E
MKPPPRLLRTPPGEPLAWVVRGRLAESVHTGHLLVLDSVSERLRVGDPDAPMFARSSLKPIQALAMLRAGVNLDGAQLALACGSHTGTPEHVAVARSTLASVGLSEDALQNTPDWPQDGASRSAVVREGGVPAAVTQNCSGKHAAMLATCVAAGWDPGSYLSSRHPLQRLIGETVTELTGVRPEETGVDGCGAPLFSSTLRGLARAFSTLADAEPGTLERRVTDAMRARPHLVAGEGRTDTLAMRTVPGLICKGGAEGVLAAALPGGRAMVAKVADGSARPVPVLLAEGLRRLGERGPWEWEKVPVLGHGEPVGTVAPAFGD